MYRILNSLDEGLLGWEIIFEKFSLLSPSYKGSGRLSKKEYRKRWCEIHQKEERLKFSKVLSRLKRDGFVDSEAKNGNTFYSITKKGRGAKNKFISKTIKEGSE